MRPLLRVASLVVVVGAAAAFGSPPVAASPVIGPPTLWVMSADGTGQREIATDAVHRAPSWSPDGSYIAYEAYDGVAILDLLGREAVRRIPGARAPSWSPDGSEIAFVAPGPHGGPGPLTVARPDGSGRRVLSATATIGAIEWSPDGSRLAFLSCDTAPGCPPQLRLIGADGAGETAIAATGSYAGGSWSPDGASLVFDGQDGDLYVLHASTLERTNITTGEAPADAPAWGAGARIAYTAYGEAHESGVWVIDPDGTDAALVHQGSDPEWSPDGTKIVFARAGTLHVIAPGTAGAPSLTPGGNSDFDPEWSPDGDAIAYFSQEPFPSWPDHERTVAVSAVRDLIRVKVGVAGGFEPCRSGVPVKLQRREAGGWTTEVRALTSERGVVKWGAEGRSGVYRVRAPARYTGYPGDSDRCAQATSPRFRIGR